MLRLHRHLQFSVALPFILSTSPSWSTIGYILGQNDNNRREFIVADGRCVIRPDIKKWSVIERTCLGATAGKVTLQVHFPYRLQGS